MWICRGYAATVQGESLASGGLVCISLGSLWIVYVDVLRVCRVEGAATVQGGRERGLWRASGLPSLVAGW